MTSKKDKAEDELEKPAPKGVTEKHREHEDGAGANIDGPHVLQKKPKLGEVATGPNATMDDVGVGSLTEEASVVHAANAEATTDRVVQQGDEVILVTANPVDGNLESRGRILKINADSTVAVRVPRADGNGVFDFSPVYAAPQEGAQPWFKWPAKETLDA